MSLILPQVTLYFEILLKATLNTVTLTLNLDYNYLVYVLFYLSSKTFKYICFPIVWLWTDESWALRKISTILFYKKEIKTNIDCWG